MDRYKKAQTPKPEIPRNENEIRITSQGLVRNYISYATSLLQERRGREIVLKAMGQAINKTVAITEIIKRRFPRLHQDTAISSVSINDVWEPIEEGLLPVETSRQVSMISITLSTKELNKNSPGYQAPPNVEHSRPQHNYQQHLQQPRQQHRQARPIYSVVNESDDSYGRVRGQARGRVRGRGLNRGGYGNYQRNYQGNYEGNYRVNYQGNYQENGGYPNWAQGGGRDGGYGYRTGYSRGRGYGRSHGRKGYHTRDGGNRA